MSFFSVQSQSISFILMRGLSIKMYLWMVLGSTDRGSTVFTSSVTRLANTPTQVLQDPLVLEVVINEVRAAEELPLVVHRRNHEQGRPQQVVQRGDQPVVRRPRVYVEGADAHLADREGEVLQNLVVLAGVGRADVDDLPAELVGQLAQGLELDLDLDGRVEGRLHHRDRDVRHSYF